MSSQIIRVIGDVHGKFRRLVGIIKNAPSSIQVGDMGVGFIRFGGYKHGSFEKNPPHRKLVEFDCTYIRGNHDNPRVCKQQSQCIPDGTVKDNMMFIGGAFSVDRIWRQADYNWWHDEELSYSELQLMITIYEAAKPEIMITHECPERTAHFLCAHAGRSYYDDKSRTREALSQMFEIHQPKIWFFGHWHHSFDMFIDGTRFICLNELEYADLDTKTFEIINKGQG